ncbi:molybdopterin synthase subunit MoaE [Luteococcus japonicus]|uniref:Molybdopterin synthase subunit MoaE n=1 Tax=Luteococcus japonicus TaxID=33984 RepID=A0A3N1ZY72_9ACTN|nr:MULTISPECIES: molybdenum cofactor biosynthesis protein MoaE [Luteococcus]MDN5564561.1 molybdenum cofactor biosynthesis protein MoaE [Luteococcus sp.]ROR55427.1 molybdopterin synthase subunit MoaE [Luteococcus japonicus]
MPHADVSDVPLDPVRARNAVLGDADGACVLFEGVVRNHDHGRGVTALSYSAHPDAVGILTSVVEEVEREFGVTAFAEHRVGDLRVGDVALLAACASAHRAEAFRACGELVDRIKVRVPVWKNQVFDDGSTEWVGLGDC